MWPISMVVTSNVSVSIDRERDKNIFSTRNLYIRRGVKKLVVEKNCTGRQNKDTACGS